MRAKTLHPNAAPQGHGNEPLDLVHLRRYTFGNRELEKEVLSLFLAQLPETLVALSTARSERDWRMAAHTLKGSSRAVGAWHLGDLAETMETPPLVDASDARLAAFARLNAAAAEVGAFILSTYSAD